MSIVTLSGEGVASPGDARDVTRAVSRAAIAALVGVCLLHVTLAMILRQHAILVGDDDAGYVLLARAIREGHYRALQHVGLPWEARFPPGYPLLLAGVTAIFGERLDAMLIAGIVVSVVGLVLLFDLVRRRWSPGFALVVCALVAINPSQVMNAGRLVSETLFGTTVILALWLAERSATGERNRAGTASWSIAVAGIAALVRSIGVTLLVALCATWAIQHRYRRAMAVGALALVIGGGWSVWTAAAPEARARRTYGSVLADWVLGAPRARSATMPAGPSTPPTATSRATDTTMAGAATPMQSRRPSAWRFVHRPARSAVQYATDFIPWVLAAPSIPGTRIDNVIWLAACVACAVAGAAVMWSRLPTVVGHVVVYVLFLLFWPAFLARFAEPLVPFLILWLLAGARVIGSRLMPRWPSAIFAAMALLLVPNAVHRDAMAATIARACDRAHPLSVPGCTTEDASAFLAAARFAGTLPAADSVFLAPKERPFYFYSGRRTLVMDAAVESGADTLGAYLRHTAARHVVIGQVGFPAPYEALRDALLKSCRDFDVVREFAPSALMLRVRSAADPAVNSQACEAIARLPEAKNRAD